MCRVEFHKSGFVGPPLVLKKESKGVFSVTITSQLGLLVSFGGKIMCLSVINSNIPSPPRHSRAQLFRKRHLSEGSTLLGGSPLVAKAGISLMVKCCYVFPNMLCRVFLKPFQMSFYVLNQQISKITTKIFFHYNS